MTDVDRFSNLQGSPQERAAKIRSETTGREVASIAARGVIRPEDLSHEDIRKVCASALTQRTRSKL